MCLHVSTKFRKYLDTLGLQAPWANSEIQASGEFRQFWNVFKHRTAFSHQPNNWKYLELSPIFSAKLQLGWNAKIRHLPHFNLRSIEVFTSICWQSLSSEWRGSLHPRISQLISSVVVFYHLIKVLRSTTEVWVANMHFVKAKKRRCKSSSCALCRCHLTL